MTSHATFSYFILYRKPCYKKYHKCKFSCDIGQLHLLCVGEGTEGWEERQRSRTLTQLASIVFIFSFSATDTDFYLCLGSGENEVLKDSPPLFFFLKEKGLRFYGMQALYSLSILDLAVRIQYCLVVLLLAMLLLKNF